MASRPLFLCLLCTIATLGSVQVAGVGVGLEFAKEPAKSVVASKGKPLVLACAAGGPSEGASVSWLVNGSAVVLSERVVVQPNGSLVFKKIIHQPSHTDQGLYQCKLTSQDGVSLLSQTSTLRVAGMAANFTLSPKNISIEAGDSARLSCHIDAVPSPAFLWERDGKTLPHDARYIVLPSGVLLVDSVQPSDQGMYRCVASTKKYKRASAGAFFEVTTPLGQFRPAEMLTEDKSVNIQVQTGEDLFLECGASGSPVPTLRWSTLAPDGLTEIDLKVADRAGTNVLSILNITVEFGHVYICRATNRDSLSKEHFAQIMYNISVLVAPSIEKMPQSLMYPIAKTVRFECELDGVPKPNQTWYKNGEPLHINGRIKQKAWSLVLSNTVKEDSGIYQCRGWNEAGEVWAAAKLIQQVRNEDSSEKPTGLKCSNITTSSMLLTWNAVTKPVAAYTLHYLPTAGGEETQEVPQDTSITVTRLKTDTNYTFYVRAYTINSASEPSETIICQTDGQRPTIAPVLTMLQAISPTSVKVGWKQLTPTEARSKITKHKLQYRVLGTLSAWVNEVPADVYNYTIRGMTPGEKYDVRVLTGTRAGWPVLKEEQQLWWSIDMPDSNDTVPLAPDVDVREINSTAIRASWSMSKKNKIQPSTYRVSLLKNDVLYHGPFDVDSSASSYIFNNIDLEASLLVQVQALNEEGEVGDTGFKVFQHDRADDPDGLRPPWSLDAMAISPNSIKLSWEGPSDAFFSISCQPLTTDVPILINSSKLSVLISNLEPFTTYELMVRMFDKNLNLGPSSQKVECQTLEDVPGPPVNLIFTKVNSTAGRVSWSAPSESHGKLRSYRIYYTPEENPSRPVDEWAQLSSNQTLVEITGLTHTCYSITVKASTQAGYGEAAELMQLRLPDNGDLEPGATVSIPTSHYTILLAILCGAVAVLIIIGVIVTLRLAKPHVLRSPDHNIPHTNGNGLRHNESIDLIAISSNIPPASADHLDTKGWYPTPKTNGAHSNGRVPNGVSTPLLTQVHITENPQFDTHGEGRNACPTCPGPGSNSRGCSSCQGEPLLAADVTQVTVLGED